MRKTGQKGMTLIEVVIVVALVGLIGTVTSSATIQFTKVTSHGDDQLQALHDIRNAAYWISIDGHMAQSTDLPTDETVANSVTLQWTDYYAQADVPHTSSYTLSGTELERNYDGSVTTVAQYISSIEFSISNRTMTVTIVSSTGVHQEERTCTIHLQPTG